MSGVATFVNATQSAIASVLQPIAAVQSRVRQLLASAVNTTTSVTTLGGIAPYNPIAQSAASLGLQVASFESQPSLLSLQGVMGRMAGNLNSVRTNSSSVTTAGGNLQTIAAKQYGDATSWTAIAKANGMTDPVVSGVQTLTVPVQPDTAGGVLGN
jgi:nucleoid-associated protein YgaU